MKRLLLPLLALLIPSAHATNYVECEAIRAVIMRNEIQMDKATKDAISRFKTSKIKEKYNGKGYCVLDFPYGTSGREECKEFEETITTVFSDEAEKFIEPSVNPYREIEKRATNDFKKRGCYYF